MRRLYFVLAAVLATAPVVVLAQDWGQASRIEIDLANFKFTPDTLNLKQGQPYVLHFNNQASGGHDFVAKAFFAAATIAPEDRAHINDGEIELTGGQSVDVRLLAPAAGTYEVHCSHFMHSSLGMKAQIVVQ